MASRIWVYYLISTALLTASFSLNPFQVAGTTWFESYGPSNEHQILGRMMIAEEEGLLAYGGLSGWIRAREFPLYKQREIYESRVEIIKFVPYYSQVGLQGTIFAVYEVMVDLPRSQKIQILYGLNALLSALGVSVLMTWLGVRFGPTAFAFALATTVFSPWVTVFGRSLYWVIWAFYLPFGAVAWISERQRTSSPASSLEIFAVVGAAVFAKCLLIGYEFITTTLLMMAVPLVYEVSRQRLSSREFVRMGALISAASIAAILSSMLILSFQIAAVEGSFSAGLKHLLVSAERRTHDDPLDHEKMYRGSLSASTGEVVEKYLSGTALGVHRPFDGLRPQDLDPKGRITYGDLILLFAAFSAAALGLAYWLREESQEGPRLVALVILTWFAFLAPMSWFVIFKSHSYIHTHVNFIAWHWPFVPVGFALVGCSLGIACGVARESISKRS